MLLWRHPLGVRFRRPAAAPQIGVRTVDVRAHEAVKPESDMEHRERMSRTPAPKKTAAARTAKIRKFGCSRPQWSPARRSRARLAVHGVRRRCTSSCGAVLVVAGFASSAASAAKAAADTSFAILTLGSVGALLLLYVGAQDDVDAEPKRRTTEEEDAENTTSRLAAVLKKVPTPPVPAVPEVVKKVAKAVPTPPVPAVLKREPKEPEEELTCAPPPPADAPHDAPARRPATSLLTAVRAPPLVTGALPRDPISRPPPSLQVFAASCVRPPPRGRAAGSGAGEGAGAAGRAAAEPVVSGSSRRSRSAHLFPAETARGRVHAARHPNNGGRGRRRRRRRSRRADPPRRLTPKSARALLALSAVSLVVAAGRRS